MNKQGPEVNILVVRVHSLKGRLQFYRGSDLDDGTTQNPKKINWPSASVYDNAIYCTSQSV